MAQSFLLLAQAAGNPAFNWIFLLGMVAVMYFLIFRPQQKAANAHKALIAALKKGDDVVTQGGILGKIHAVGDRDVQVEIAAGVRIRVLKSSITAKRQATDETAPVKADDAAKDKESK